MTFHYCFNFHFTGNIDHDLIPLSPIGVAWQTIPRADKPKTLNPEFLDSPRLFYIFWRGDTMRGLSFGELLDYCAEETNHWRDFFKTNPAALEVPCDIAGTKNVREVVLHIVAAQMRYAERLLNLPITEYDTLSGKSGDDLFLLGHKSLEDLRSFAVAANDPDWDGKLTFPTRSAGTLTASRRKIFIHALLHSLRHWAQLATFLRQHGYKQEWQHDFLFSRAIS